MSVPKYPIHLDADGRINFWRTMLAYWARFVPFWVVFAICCLIAWMVLR